MVQDPQRIPQVYDAYNSCVPTPLVLGVGYKDLQLTKSTKDRVGHSGGSTGRGADPKHEGHP